jgi:hypothetical protein
MIFSHNFYPIFQVSTSRSTSSRACSLIISQNFAHPEAGIVWILSLSASRRGFAVTCPLLMLLWIYDVLLLEGACKTLIWIALSLM